MVNYRFVGASLLLQNIPNGGLDLDDLVGVSDVHGLVYDATFAFEAEQIPCFRLVQQLSGV